MGIAATGFSIFSSVTSGQPMSNAFETLLPGISWLIFATRVATSKEIHTEDVQTPADTLNLLADSMDKLAVVVGTFPSIGVRESQLTAIRLLF